MYRTKLKEMVYIYVHYFKIGKQYSFNLYRDFQETICVNYNYI